MTRKKLTDYSNRDILISPSLLAADFARLENELKVVETSGAELLHLDIMDGHFVPNISYGPPVISALRKHSGLIFDVHLMISHPLKYAEAFAKAGADHMTFHIESEDDPHKTIEAIHKLGCTAGLSVKPGTPVEMIYPFLNEIEMVLIMSVEPGFGGQSFMPQVLPKASALRRKMEDASLAFHIEIDGGIDAKTAPLAVESGCNVLVAGTAVFRHPQGIEAAVSLLKG